MSDSNDELMMETMYWWGIPTLFRCEHNKGLAECDIALAVGKKGHDNRDSIKSRDWQRQKERELREGIKK